MGQVPTWCTMDLQEYPRESTLEKPSFLLFGLDCRHPTEAAFMPQTLMDPVIVTDYREELVKSIDICLTICCRGNPECTVEIQESI